MSPYERRQIKRFEQRLHEQAPLLEGDVFAAWRFLRSKYSLAELTRAIENGTIESLFTQEVLSEAFEPVARGLQQQFATAIDWAAKDLKLGVAQRVFFDTANPRHVAAVDEIRTKVIENAKADVIDTLRTATRDGLERGANPRTTARQLREVIGLSDGQAKAVRTFREALESGDRSVLSRAMGRGVITTPDGKTTVRAGHAGGFGLNPNEIAELKRDLGNKPIDPKKIAKWSEQYRKRTEALHAETVATTATLDAMKHGQHEATASAIEKGFYRSERMASRWVTNLDGRERPLHHDMNGTIVKFGQPFVRTGEIIPGSSTYKCRCIKVDYQLTEKQMAKADPFANPSVSRATLALT